jgi:hypothetical protein
MGSGLYVICPDCLRAIRGLIEGIRLTNQMIAPSIRAAFSRTAASRARL